MKRLFPSRKRKRDTQQKFIYCGLGMIFSVSHVLLITTQFHYSPPARAAITNWRRMENEDVGRLRHLPSTSLRRSTCVNPFSPWQYWRQSTSRKKRLGFLRTQLPFLVLMWRLTKVFKTHCENLTPSSGRHRHCMHLMHRCTCKQNSHTHTNNKQTNE